MGLATWLVVAAALPADPAGVTVMVAARDLAAGAVLSAGDVREHRLDPALAGAGGLAEPAAAVGQRLAAPIAAGEVVTETRLLSAGALARLEPGARAVHVPLPDAGTAGALSAGDHVEVIRTVDGARVATDLVVLEVAGQRGSQGGWGLGGGEASGVLLAVPAASAGAVIQAAYGSGRAAGVQLAIRPRR